ncbi:hypothetical protein R1flu_003858 [Riccia fluitans]|uniref:uracil phosphoribosyltransferase n=1 Tax=Riccia fluitans TaxID=41844 RepID=A0ABD1YA66_9MARC
MAGFLSAAAPPLPHCTGISSLSASSSSSCEALHLQWNKGTLASSASLLQGLRVGNSPQPANSVRKLRKSLSVKCAVAINNKPIGGDQMLVYVPPHPLIKHWVSVLRNEMTPSPLFRSAMGELGRILIYEASRDWLVTVSGEIQTPCGIAECEFIDPREPVKVVPILRAGLVLVEQIGSVLPATQTYHLGYVRDEETLEPTLYLNKLPERFPEGSRVLITDPTLATGGTIVAALEELRSRGADPKLMRVICAVAAPPALTKLSEKFPGLKVYAGIIDPELNDKGYIIPGLGDAGDRSYNTGF